MRKLATVETIQSVIPHPNADLLELATVRNWQVCVKKGEFQPGEPCVYCEIDSVLPQKPEFEFLAERKYRIRTIKLRGELSQGIIFPVNILPYWDSFVVGDDVTEVLGVTLYEPPSHLSLGGDAIGLFPSFIPKTDEERIQNCWGLFQEHQNRLWVGTEKLDGCSMTLHFHHGEFGVSSRNLQLRDTDGNLYWNFVNKNQLDEKLIQYCQKNNRNLALQGELIGPKIQGNRYNLPSHQWHVFNIFDIDQQDYYHHDAMLDTLSELSIPSCPVIKVNQSLGFSNIKELLEYSDGMSALSNTMREGIVWRTLDKPRISFKAISNSFLLKNKD